MKFEDVLHYELYFFVENNKSEKDQREYLKNMKFVYILNGSLHWWYNYLQRSCFHQSIE
jgi:hypothetical protein